MIDVANLLDIFENDYFPKIPRYNVLLIEIDTVFRKETD